MTHDHPTTIAVCPRCQSQLALPAAPPADAQLECPVCTARFALAGVSVRALPMARIADAPEPAPAAPFAWSLPDLAASGVHVLEPTPPEPTPLEIAATLIAKAPSLVPSAGPDLPGDDDGYDAGAVTLPMTHEATIKLADDLRLESRNGVDDFSAEDLAPSAASTEAPADAGTATVPIVPDDFVATIAELEAPEESAASEAPEDDSPDDWTDIDSQQNADHAEEPLTLRTGPSRRRRKPSSVRMVAGVVVFGAIGLLLGAYALLWIKGARGDVFQLASHLPSWMLPPSMHLADQAGDPSVGEAGERSTGDAAPTAKADSDALLAGGADPVTADPEVTPAAADGAPDEDDAVVPATAEASVGEPSAPAVNWPVTAILGDVNDLQTFTLAELDERLSAGEPAAERFIAGDLSQRDSVREVGQAYIELCALAEAYTLLEPATYGTDLFTKQAVTKATLKSTAAPAQRADLAVVAAKWLGHDGRTNHGALFVGTVRDLGVQGPWTESVIEVGEGEQSAEVHVLTDGIKFSTGAAAGVAGAIIDRPQERIAGYQGDATQVIIAGFTFDPATVVDVDSPPAEFPLLSE